MALFLDGKDDELLRRLDARMREAARDERYEIAGAVRDQIKALERTLEEQRVVSSDFRDQDVVRLLPRGRVRRDGRALDPQRQAARAAQLLAQGAGVPDEEMLSSFVSLYYDLGAFIPDEVLLPVRGRGRRDARPSG